MYNKTIEELFALLTEEDVKEIVLQTDPKVKDTTHWRFKKDNIGYRVCITDVIKDEDLSPDNFTEIILNDNLDLYCQSNGFRSAKYRVGNLFNAYKKMFEILEKKTELVLA